MQSLKTSSLPTSTGNLTALAHKEQHEKRMDRRAKWLRGGATARPWGIQEAQGILLPAFCDLKGKDK